MRRKPNYTPIIVLAGFAVLTLTAVGGAVAVAVIRTQADQKTTAPPTLTPSAPKAEKAKRRNGYAHLIGSTADEVRKELGTPSAIGHDPVYTDGDPFNPKPVKVRTVTWIYDGPPRIEVLLHDDRVIAVN